MPAPPSVPTHAVQLHSRRAADQRVACVTARAFSGLVSAPDARCLLWNRTSAVQAPGRHDVRPDQRLRNPRRAGYRRPVLARSWLLVSGARYDGSPPRTLRAPTSWCSTSRTQIAPKDKGGGPGERGALADPRAAPTGCGSTDSGRPGGPTISRCWPTCRRGRDAGDGRVRRPRHRDGPSGCPTFRSSHWPRPPADSRRTSPRSPPPPGHLPAGVRHGDFRRDTGFGRIATLAYARARFTIAAKAAPSPGPIDGPTGGSSALKLSEATAVSAGVRDDGQDLPDPGPVRAGERGTLPVAGRDRQGVLRRVQDRDGGEIRSSDLPRIAQANKILDLARLAGIEVSPSTTTGRARPAPSDHLPLVECIYCVMLRKCDR